MKIRTKKIIVVFLVCMGILFFSGASRAEVDYAAQQRIITVIDGYNTDMGKRAGALVEAIGRARDAGSTDPQLWQEVDKRRSEYIQTVQQTLPLIDQMVKGLLDINPVAQVPQVSIPLPFGDVLTEAEAEQKEASEFASRFLEAYQFCQNELLKARLDNIEAIQQSMNKFLSTAAGVSMSTYAGGRIFAPKLVRFSPLTGLLSAVWGLRGDADAINTIIYRRQTWERLSKDAREDYQNLKPALEHFEAVVKSIRVWHQESLKLTDEAKKYGGIWLKDVENAVEKKKREDEENYQKDKNKQQPTINLGGGGYIPPIPPLTPADYMGDVNSILSGLESEYKGVRDGGDPKTFEEARTRTWDQTVQAIAKAGEAVDRGYEALAAAQRQYNQDCQPIWTRYNAIMARGNWCGGCSGNPEVQRLNAQVVAEAEGYLRPALAAAVAPVFAAGAALVEPIRQRSKAVMIAQLVTEGYWKLQTRLYYDGQLLAGQFRAIWQQGEAAMEQEVGKVYSMFYNLADVYTIDTYRSFADNMDGWVQGQLNGGVSPEAIQTNLMDTARTVRAIDEKIKQALSLIDQTQQKGMQEAQRAKDTLLSFLTKHGKLIIPYLGYYYPISREGDQVELMRAQVTIKFTVTEWEGLKALRQANLGQIASRIEAKSKDLDEALGWIDLYRGRLSVAAFRLNKISMEVLDKELYSLLSLNAGQLLTDVEFKKPEWQGLFSIIDSAVPVKDRTGLAWAAMTPWEARLPRDRLNLGLQVFYIQLQEVFKYYLQARQSGGFVPINMNQYNEAVKHWEEVLAAIKIYNEKITPIVAETSAARENVAKFKEPVTAVYEKMPAYLKKIVAGSHQRFLRAAGILEGFFLGKESAIAPLSVDTNGHMKAITEWLTGYKKAKDDYDEREKRNLEMFQEMERQRKAEEQRRIEDQKQKGQSELNAVKDLYGAFKNAYEARNDALLVSYLSKDWQALDGTNITGLQNNLRRTFRVFDEIRYDMQNLNIEKKGDGVYTARYDLTITSKIYKRNLKHEEKATISEEVIIEASGKAKIGRTMEGRFWMQ